MMDPTRERLADLLTHYFRTVFQAAGLTWNSDNYSEMDTITDLVIDLVRSAIRETEDAA